MTTEAQTENANETEHDDAAEDGGKRERSTIEFPYTNLEDAEEAAKSIFKEAGTTEITIVQVASALGLSASSSGFRVKMSSLKLYGLVEGDTQRASLTELGREIAEPTMAEAARVQAFMRVPLYQAVVQQHEGRTLPPPAAFQRELAGLGVAVKSTERARQVFDRSARHAGFLKAGSDRFVTPIIQGRGRARDDAQPAPETEAARDTGGRGGDGGGIDPVIQALVKKIPPTGSQWPLEEQVQLLQMLAMAFHMTYKNKRPIKVSTDAELATMQATAASL